MSLKVPPSRFETLPARIIIYVLAFAGLGVIMTVRQSTKPSGLADFSVFYLGGQVARQGAWDDLYPIVIPGAVEHPGLPTASDPKPLYTRISDIAVVPYRQDQAPRLDFWGSAVRNDTREGDTLWVNYTWSHFSSRSTVS